MKRRPTGLTLADLALKTGAKPRSLQLWTDSGALKTLEGTDRAGSGAYRHYSIPEAELAAILAKLHKTIRLPVGSLLRLAALIRPLIADAPLFYERARKGEAVVQNKADERRYSDGEAIDRARRKAVPVWLILTPEPGRDAPDARLVSGQMIPTAGGDDPLRERGFFLALNLSDLLGNSRSATESQPR
jgi:hypothetical protein